MTESQKALFPNMPSEVFDLWIEPNIAEYNWPFTSVTQSVEGTRWDRFFCGRPLIWWAEASWKRQSFSYNPDVLDPVSLQRVTWVLESGTGVRYTPTSSIHDTHKRFWACVDYVTLHGAFPVPIVCISGKGGKVIADGHHRIAAFLHCGAPPGFVFDAWVADNETQTIVTDG